MGPLLIDIRKELDAAMLIIEHDMPLIMSMSDRVYCLELGTVIAEGDPSTRAQRPEGHRQLPRHGRTHDRPQRQQGADVDPDADGSVRAHGRYRHTGSQFTSSPSRWRQV